jgi:hypothetical protein
MVVLAGTSFGAASPIDQLIAGAKKEGAIEFYGPSTLGPEGAQALGAAFNKKYGLNIKLNYSPSGNMTRDTAKIVGMAASGQPPEWDIMVVTDAHHGSLFLRKLHHTFDYAAAGVTRTSSSTTAALFPWPTSSRCRPTTASWLRPRMCPEGGKICSIPNGRESSASLTRRIISDVSPPGPGAKRRRSIS